MKRIRKIIDTNLAGKKVLLLFLLTNIVYAVMLAVTIPKTMAFSNGLKLLDMMPLGYDLEYINMLFETGLFNESTSSRYDLSISLWSKLLPIDWILFKKTEQT